MAFEGEDLISQLPDSLLHQILSLMPVIDAARTSTLSKRWNCIWETRPSLDFGSIVYHFCCDHYPGPLRLKKRKYLLQVANKTILRRCQQQIPNLEKLHIAIPEHKISTERLNGKLETWMRALAKSGLRELALESCMKDWMFKRDFSVLPSMKDYFASGDAILPPSILLATSIRVLHLSCFNLMSLSSVVIKFPSLQNLSLSCLKLEDRIMEKLIEGCPLLETLKLEVCKGLNNLYVGGLQKLRQVELRKTPDLRMLKVEGTPNLQTLTISAIAPSAVVDVTACACLRRLVLYGEFITENLFWHFVSQSPFLEHLSIGGSKAFNKIKLSTNTIKELRLLRLHDLAEAEISAPMLETFMFVNGDKPLPTFFLNASNLLQVSLDLNGCPTGEREHVMKFLEYFNHCRTVKLFGGSVAKLIIPKEQRDGLESPLYGTRDLVLAPHMKIKPGELVEHMLCLCPRAKSLSIGSSLNKIEIVLKFLYEKNDPCCKLFQSECWRHCLAEVRIEKFYGEEDDMTNLKNLFHRLGENLKIVGNPVIARTLPKFDSFDGLYSCYNELFS